MYLPHIMVITFLLVWFGLVWFGLSEQLG